jgi:hypothetical protein
MTSAGVCAWLTVGSTRALSNHKTTKKRFDRNIDDPRRRIWIYDLLCYKLPFTGKPLRCTTKILIQSPRMRILSKRQDTDYAAWR